MGAPHAYVKGSGSTSPGPVTRRCPETLERHAAQAALDDRNVHTWAVIDALGSPDVQAHIDLRWSTQPAALERAAGLVAKHRKQMNECGQSGSVAAVVVRQAPGQDPERGDDGKWCRHHCNRNTCNACDAHRHEPSRARLRHVLALGGRHRLYTWTMRNVDHVHIGHAVRDGLMAAHKEVRRSPEWALFVESGFLAVEVTRDDGVRRELRHEVAKARGLYSTREIRYSYRDRGQTKAGKRQAQAWALLDTARVTRYIHEVDGKRETLTGKGAFDTLVDGLAAAGVPIYDETPWSARRCPTHERLGCAECSPQGWHPHGHMLTQSPTETPRTCNLCKGSGRRATGRPCKRCDGTGQFAQSRPWVASCRVCVDHGVYECDTCRAVDRQRKRILNRGEVPRVLAPGWRHTCGDRMTATERRAVKVQGKGREYHAKLERWKWFQRWTVAQGEAAKRRDEARRLREQSIPRLWSKMEDATQGGLRRLERLVDRYQREAAALEAAAADLERDDDGNVSVRCMSCCWHDATTDVASELERKARRLERRARLDAARATQRARREYSERVGAALAWGLPAETAEGRPALATVVDLDALRVAAEARRLAHAMRGSRIVDARAADQGAAWELVKYMTKTARLAGPRSREGVAPLVDFITDTAGMKRLRWFGGWSGLEVPEDPNAVVEVYTHTGLERLLSAAADVGSAATFAGIRLTPAQAAVLGPDCEPDENGTYSWRAPPDWCLSVYRSVSDQIPDPARAGNAGPADDPTMRDPVPWGAMRRGASSLVDVGNLPF